MEYREIPPPPVLADTVRCFWFLRGTGGAHLEPVVPDGRAELILHLAEPFAVADGGSATLRRQATALIAGQLTRPLYVVPSGRADVIGVRFRTAAAGPALGMAMDELAERVLPLAEVLPRLVPALEAAAGRAVDPGARAAALADVLLRVRRAVPDARTQTAVARLAQGRSVRAVVPELGTTARTLERRLRREVGLVPRMLRQILRFRRTFRRLSGAPPGTWARVAAESGYADQAHMNREFRRFTGRSPSAFFGTDPALARALAGAVSHPF